MSKKSYLHKRLIKLAKEREECEEEKRKEREEFERRKITKVKQLKERKPRIGGRKYFVHVLVDEVRLLGFKDGEPEMKWEDTIFSTGRYFDFHGQAEDTYRALVDLLEKMYEEKVIKK